MKFIDMYKSDSVVGNEFFHVTQEGEVLQGEISKEKGTNCISTEHICSCGKDTYDTYEAAKKALKLRKNRDKDVYKCNICGYWHLTSKDGSKRKRKFDKRSRNISIKVNDRELKDYQKFRKSMKNRPSYYRVIKDGPVENKLVYKTRLSDICNIDWGELKNE